MTRSALSQLGRRTEAPPISWLMKTALERPRLISLAAGFTDNATLPVAETRELMRRVLVRGKRGQAALQYGSTAGDPELRRLTARLLDREDAGGSSRFSDPQRIVITSGSQQLLYLVTECLCDPGDIVLVEDPTYFVFLGIAQSHCLRCFGVTMREDGLDLARLEQTLEYLKRRGELRRLKLLYLVSYHQNPTGVTTVFAKKAAALDLLLRYERFAGHPIYLLEDAAYRALRFTGGDEPSALCAKRGAGRVIYMSTFSKPFATGIRIGYGCLPAELHEVVLRVKGNHDFGSASLLQKLIAEALKSGAYERHLPRLQARYRRKAAVMGAALRRHFPQSATCADARGGLYFWVRAPEHVSTGPKSRLFRKALARDVLYVPGVLCYADDPRRKKPDCELRLSFGNASEAHIREGIKRLGEALQTRLDSR